MSYRIEYTSKWTGQKEVHVNNNNVADAQGWAKSLSQDNGSKATVYHVADHPWDNSGKVTEISSIGSN